MKTWIFLVLITTNTFPTQTLASDSVPGKTNRVITTNSLALTGALNDLKTRVKSPIAKLRKTEWDKTDFWTTVGPWKEEATDTFAYKRWASKNGKNSLGPMIESSYSHSASGIAHEQYFVGLFFNRKLK